MGENGKTDVLLAAPTSYLGRRLMLKLMERPEVRLRVLVADRRNLGGFPGAAPEIVEGDIFDDGVLRRAAEGVDAAYFPVRFLGTDPGFDRQVKVFAAKFRDACAAEGVGRIVFLGVLTRKEARNETIKAMIETGEILSARPERIPTVWLRAGFILGSGSLLFDVLRNLVQKLPVLPTPRWMEKRISVIGARDLQEYLVQAIRIPLSGNVEVEIGLPPRSLRDMLAATARVMGLSRVFLPVPFNAKRLSPAILMLLTPFSVPLSSMFLRMVVAAGKTHGNTPAGECAAPLPRDRPGDLRGSGFAGGRGDRTGGGGQPVDRQHRPDRRFRRGEGDVPLHVPGRPPGEFRNRPPGEDLPGGEVDRGEERLVPLRHPLADPGRAGQARRRVRRVGRTAGGGRTCGWATSSTSGR